MFVCAWSQDDGAVMQKLKTKINPNGWSNKDFCKWENVHCNGRRVTQIQIPEGLNVQGSLPQELVNLPELTLFQCSNCKGLSGDFPRMPNSLQYLSISNNSFTSMPNDFFINMSN
ncbi:putative receptor protein kinase TMK1-like, partial [Trifolium medium]|nr:putative receptor protein kinase TMK1-like [Trifolium medium]